MLVYLFNIKQKNCKNLVKPMKTTETIITYAFALIFLVFALNYFFDFMPMPPLEGDAATYMMVLGSTGYMTAVKFLELAVAVMLLVNFQRPLAWLLILPVATNILMYDVFVVGMPALGVPVMLMNLFMVYRHRRQYACLLT